VGDSGFAYDALVNLTEEIWIWNPFLTRETFA
jgi:hypothetical protein